MNRRNFLKLIGIGGAIAMVPVVPFAPVSTNQLNHRLEQVCFALGRWSRKQNVQIQRVIVIDEVGHLVLDGKCVDGFVPDSFHIADRNHENYTQIVYRVEPLYLAGSKELSVIVNSCHRFLVVFG